MFSISRNFGHLGVVKNAIFGAKAVSILLGSAIIGVAITSASTGWTVDVMLDWSAKILSASFLVMFGGLLFLSLMAVLKIHGCSIHEPGVRSWFAGGVQAANGIATLALTYTLLGISLGISSLSNQELNPTTIPEVIKGLTAHFSMAFMTTVIGLPISALLRSLLMIYRARAAELGKASNHYERRFVLQGD